MAKTENKNVIKRPGDKTIIYCQEEYAQEMYDRLYGLEVVCKDLKNGDILKVSRFNLISEEKKEIEAICENFTSLYFNFSKEKKYFQILGLDEESFVEWISSEDHEEEVKSMKMYIQVENMRINQGSLYSAHLKTIVKEFKEQITKPTSAYTAKVIDKNQGGFIVDVQGIKAFLPGSLAAANKIVDFEAYIGKEVYVMIEDYLAPSKIFVVSHKKYLEYILPSKLGELERNQKMVGHVTGTSKFGVFVEFEEIFTGLLHSAEMLPETYEKFKSNSFRVGDEIEAWLKDIRDSKLILTEKDPAEKISEYESYKEKVEGNFKEASIISIKSHGALMEIEKGVLGLLPVKEMKKYGKRLNVGEILEVFVKKVDASTGKIYLTMNDERITTEI